jgi:hypothetical protein
MDYKALNQLDNQYPDTYHYKNGPSANSVILYGEFNKVNKVDFKLPTLDNLKFVRGTEFRSIIAILQNTKDTNPVYYTSEAYYKDLEASINENNPYFVLGSFDPNNIITFVVDNIKNTFDSFGTKERRSFINMKQNIMFRTGSIIDYDNLITYIDWVLSDVSPLDDSNNGVLLPEIIAGWDVLKGNYATGELLTGISASFGLGAELTQTISTTATTSTPTNGNTQNGTATTPQQTNGSFKIPQIPKLPPIPDIPTLPSLDSLGGALLTSNPVAGAAAALLQSLPSIPKLPKIQFPKLKKPKLKKPKKTKKEKKAEKLQLKALQGMTDSANSAVANAQSAVGNAVNSVQGAVNNVQSVAGNALNSVQQMASQATGTLNKGIITNVTQLPGGGTLTTTSLTSGILGKGETEASVLADIQKAMADVASHTATKQ